MKTIYHYTKRAEALSEDGESYNEWEIALVRLDTDTEDLWWAGRFQIWLKTPAKAAIIQWNSYIEAEAIREVVRYTNLLLKSGTPPEVLMEDFTVKS